MRIVMNRTRSGRMMVAGFVVLAMDGWEDKGEGLFLLKCKGCWGALRPRVFLGEDRMVSAEKVGSFVTRDCRIE